jgi:hypothetical protein
MDSLTRLITAAVFLAIGSLWAQDGKEGTDYDTFRVSRLLCVIGNNKALGDHRAGYNGVFRMTAPGVDTSVYVPAYAGLNLEHYFDDRPRQSERHVFFEPRYAPIEFRRLSETKAELRQLPTPVYGVESRTVFELHEPYYLDMSYRAIPRRSDFEGGYLGIFWASYMNGPHDKSIYFLRGGSTLDKPQWVQFATQTHGRESTVLSAEVEPPGRAVADEPTPLFRSFSPLRYSEPFYYGRFGDMVLIYIFRPSPYLRFAHSPSGGGSSASGDDTNPAWDFQLVIPDPQPGREYELRMRVVYKLWSGRADVLREVREWLTSK